MATIVIAFIGVAVIHALLSGPNTANKNTNRKNQNQSREDLAEANRLLSEKNKTDQEKLLNLTKENQALKGQGLKEEIRLQPPASALKPLAGSQSAQQPWPGSQSPPASAAADMPKHAPVFSSPGEAVNFMAAQEQKKAGVTAYKPMQRVLPPPEALSTQAHQAQPVTAVTSQENKRGLEKNLLGGSRALGSPRMGSQRSQDSPTLLLLI